MTLLEFFDPDKVKHFASAIMINGGDSRIPNVAQGPATSLGFLNGLLMGYSLAGGSEAQMSVVQERIQEVVNQLMPTKLEIPTAEDIAALGKPPG